jgi:hypothetical protein
MQGSIHRWRFPSVAASVGGPIIRIVGGCCHSAFSLALSCSYRTNRLCFVFFRRVQHNRAGSASAAFAASLDLLSYDARDVRRQ